MCERRTSTSGRSGRIRPSNGTVAAVETPVEVDRLNREGRRGAVAESGVVVAGAGDVVDRAGDCYNASPASGYLKVLVP